MRIFLMPLLLLFTFSCAYRNIKYDRDKILERYFSNYKILLDNKEISFPMVFLDKENIEYIRINKRDKTLNIQQLNNTKFFKIKDLNLDSITVIQKRWDQINLIMINDFLIVGRLKEDIKLDPKAITHIELLSDKKKHKLNLCGHYDDNVLLIVTK